jgi:3-(3-hydroxy-phenyl)propionate hydroxylase
MLSTYTYPRFEYRRPDEIGAPVRRVPLVVVGAGPVGLAAAIDAAQNGLPVLLLDEDNTVSVGSRGLCYAKRALEVLDRIGAGDPVVEKGVTWNVGRAFHRETEVFSFNLLPQPEHRRPGMVNLQQYWLEQFLVERARQLPNLELRWLSKVVAVMPNGQGARIEVETPDGRYTLEADWLIVADGARSPIRRMLGLDMEGKVFQDRFLIADVLLSGELFPRDQTERWFWFDPPFHPGQSVLLHREADDVWRIDFQLGWDADPEAEKLPERVTPRIRAMLDHQGYGHIGFELEWVSVYTFQCRRMKSFRHGRVLFAGDAAHQVSPFGARGANSGLQDTDNLVWKLKLVMAGSAPEALLDTYSEERGAAADENLLNSTRSTDFMTPKSRACVTLRNAVLTLANEHPFARGLVNSGRLSVPAFLTASRLNTPDAESFDGWMVPGAPMDDAPVAHDGTPGWLLGHVGNRFVLMLFADDAHPVDAAVGSALAQLARAPIGVHALVVVPAGQRGPAGHVAIEDSKGLLRERYAGRPGTCYLLRPDQHVAARWRRFDVAEVRSALAHTTCND